MPQLAVSHAPPGYDCPFCAIAAGAESEFTAWRDAHVVVQISRRHSPDRSASPRQRARDSAGALREPLRAPGRPGEPRCPGGAPRRHRHAHRLSLRRRDRAPKQRARRRPGRLAPAHPRDPAPHGRPRDQIARRARGRRRTQLATRPACDGASPPSTTRPTYPETRSARAISQARIRDRVTARVVVSRYDITIPISI